MDLTEAALQATYRNADYRADWLAISGMLLVLSAVRDAQLQRDAGVSLFSYLVMARLSEVPGRTLQMSQLAVITHGSPSKLSMRSRASSATAGCGASHIW